MNIMGIIFTNATGIGELTTKRTMASLPFGGRYRQVDFGLSNLACAGVRHVGVIARYSYQSLMNHVGPGDRPGRPGVPDSLRLLRHPHLPRQAGVHLQQHGLPGVLRR